MPSPTETRQDRIDHILAIAHKNHWSAKHPNETPGLVNKLRSIIRRQEWGRRLTTETVNDYQETVQNILRTEGLKCA